MNQEILNLVREKGILLDRDLFSLLDSFENVELAGSFLDKLAKLSGSKMINSSVLTKNVEYVQSVVRDLPGETKQLVERTFFKMGVSLEIKKETEVRQIQDTNHFSFYCPDTAVGKKIDLSDFVNHFRSRYQQIQRILMQRPDLQNLISINKLSGNRQQATVIGMVKNKRVTGNKNMIIEIEDLTGSMKALVKADSEIFSKAQELQMDDVVALRGSGNKEILFVYDIFFPDSFLSHKTRFEKDISVAFLSDVHAGSDRHLGQSFERFLEWINSEDDNAKKIKYIFFSGDNVDGVGIFPGQENVLNLKSMKEQYSLLASYLKRIPKDITIFMCPGQHDASRVAEPQPIISRKYGEELYELPNLNLVTNPAFVKLIEGDKEFKVLMYHGASIHSLINEIPELRMMKAHKTPAKAVRHMLKRRILASAHSSSVYIPNPERDPLVISEVPDILCTGEVHRLDIENYNGTIIITGSCWQAQTPFEEKVGNLPDPAKVPVFNLKSGELKIFDFGVEEEINREY